MKIEIIDYGWKKLGPLMRAHDTDAGIDVRSCETIVLHAHETKAIGVGFGIKLPMGTAGFICPRSGLASKGITCNLAVIDPGYTGEIHAIMSNLGDEDFTINAGDRIGQLMVMPALWVDPVDEIEGGRGDAGFGSTGTS